MQRVVILLGVVLLSGCVSMAPMPPESAGQIKSGLSAVAFYDVTQKINYIEDVYLVLGVAQVGSDSVYNGIWDSNKDMSSVHAEELSKIGVRARSVYDTLQATEIPEFTAMQKEMYDQVIAGQDAATFQLKPRTRELLLQKGFDYLFWLTWSGYTLHLQTLGLPAIESCNTGYWIFDLKQNKLLWNGSINATERIKVHGKGKSFLEKNDLSGLKTEAIKLTRNRYKSRAAGGYAAESVGQAIGLEVKM